MILVDTSVWIDHFRSAPTAAAEHLDRIRGTKQVLIADLILTELLQGCRDDRHAARLLAALSDVAVVEAGGRTTAIAAATNYRTLRAAGVTVRKTIDTLIATVCIRSGLALLYSDRDFDPFVQHLGLISELHLRPS